MNSAEENTVVVEMAEAALTNKGDGLDYWIGAVETDGGQTVILTDIIIIIIIIIRIRTSS